MERKCRILPLSQQPLVLVLCQIRITPVLKMKDFIPEIQEHLRHCGYPDLKVGKTQEILFTESGMQTKEQEYWAFIHQDEKSNLLLFQNNFILQKSNYTNFEEYAAELAKVSSIILTTSESDRCGRIQRIGLRYIDLIQPKALEDHRLYLQPGFHGPAAGAYDAGSGRLKIECIGQTTVNSLPGTLIIRVSQNDQGWDIPPDLLGNAPKRDRRVQPGELVTFIDMDHYINGSFAASVDQIQSLVFPLHDRIIDTFHDHIVSKEAIALWR